MKTLTTKEVSRLCSVSDATVKRWEEAGVLTSERTAGGHRRFRVEEVARFQKEQSLGIKVCHGDESVVSAASRRRENWDHSESPLFHSLVVGQEEEASNLLINEFLNGKSLQEIFDFILAPAMRQIGELWANGELTIAQEHLATRAAVVSLHKLRSIVPIPKSLGEIAMCCAIEGDFHELPTHFTQVIFESHGLDVMNFGCNTPLYALTEEVLHYKPKLICISATVINDTERAARDYADFRGRLSKLKTPVVIGGRAFADERIRQRFPSELYAKSFGELSEFSQKLISN